MCVPRWGGDDGPDDAIENLADWPVLHALGGADEVKEMYQLGWEGHLRQYTEAKATEVPFARDGMIQYGLTGDEVLLTTAGFSTLVQE